MIPPKKTNGWNLTMMVSKSNLPLSRGLCSSSTLKFSSWWLNQPIWKICSSNWIISPGRDENKKSLKPPPSLRGVRIPPRCAPKANPRHRGERIQSSGTRPQHFRQSRRVQRNVSLGRWINTAHSKGIYIYMVSHHLQIHRQVKLGPFSSDVSFCSGVFFWNWREYHPWHPKLQVFLSAISKQSELILQFNFLGGFIFCGVLRCDILRCVANWWAFQATETATTNNQQAKIQWSTVPTHLASHHWLRWNMMEQKNDEQ